jgi:hypothetical protein
MGEIDRHLSPSTLETLAGRCLSELAVQVEAVLDCRDTTRLGLSFEDLCDDIDYRIPRAVAAAAIARGAEGLLVPSATGLGDNLIVFVDSMGPNSRLDVLRKTPMRLHVARP